MLRSTTLKTMLLGGLITMAACDYSGTRPMGADNGDPSVNADQDPTKQRNDVEIVSATGDITAAVNEYRTLLGALNPNVAGEQPGGRREVNWDGVPATFTDNDAFPGGFFNTNSPRGLLMTTDGSGFRISSNGYTDVNAAYAGEFHTFSPAKLFVARGSTTIDIHFVVAGSTTAALVDGFGSVFADVGRAQSTLIEYFDANGYRLLRVAAPRATDATGLSFLGAKFDSAIVASVRITVGDVPLDAANIDNVKQAGPKLDLVATDDFIYGEPRAARP